MTQHHIQSYAKYRRSIPFGKAVAGVLIGDRILELCAMLGKTENEIRVHTPPSVAYLQKFEHISFFLHRKRHRVAGLNFLINFSPFQVIYSRSLEAALVRP